MQTIYFELPDTYREMLKPLGQFGGLDYFQNHETVDRYVEQLVRMEIIRRWCRTDLLHVKEWFKATIAVDPISTDYFINQAIQTYIVQSTDIWRCIQRELTFTPTGQFLMWHVDYGLWKMIASGVDYYVE
ncbi:hypothetical protein BIZ78_gp259 [Erwinia phage vB_EamM_Caitlin]|uniref:hypothetical protein n=1 Tax=Erwinia phage vB_EamM_Caitlin TaxID=1883379 RepID=UPI00081CC7EA|nr:hypothetical protein BIZ78_gp259 [Erwinia phage vB_EamM_Caitlin]ANZ48316.1 hypothetical protein CAITLIN_21 [Erwinia phage vB_EamM_Caitlin]